MGFCLNFVYIILFTRPGSFFLESCYFLRDRISWTIFCHNLKGFQLFFMLFFCSFLVWMFFLFIIRLWLFVKLVGFCCARFLVTIFHVCGSYLFIAWFFLRMDIHPLDGQIPWHILFCLSCWLSHNTSLSKSCNHHRLVFPSFRFAYVCIILISLHDCY
jgi:hypothetical protein